MKRILLAWVVLCLGTTTVQGQEAEAPGITAKETAVISTRGELQERLQKIVNISFSNADLRNVLNGLAKTYGLNIVMDEKVKGAVNISLKGVTLEEALRRILKVGGYIFVIEGSILEVASAEETLVSEILDLRFLDTDVALEFLKGSSSEVGVMKGNETLNGILVTDRISNIERMKEILNKIDIPPQQVLIEAKLLDITHTDLDNFGIALSGGTFQFPIHGSGGAARALDIASGVLNLAGSSADLTTDTFSATLSKGPESVAVTLDALIRDSRVKVLASPTVVTMNNVEAKITIGEKFPIAETTQTTTGTLQTTRFVDVGITLRVTPRINREGFIQMQIHPEVSSVSSTIDAGPRITTREADTTVIVKQGESVIIAGLIQEDETLIKDRIPILGHIPFLGILFQSRSKDLEQKELIVVITPHMVPVEPPHVVEGGNLEKVRSRIEALSLYRQAEDFEMVQTLEARQTPDPFRALRSAELYEQLAHQFPKNPLAPIALWRAGELRLKQLSEPDEALKHYRRLAQEYPKHPYASSARQRLRGMERQPLPRKSGGKVGGKPFSREVSSGFPGFR